MDKMNAAVVTSFDEPPHYRQFEVPQPAIGEEMLVDVLAVGLHPRVRTDAAGARYTSTGSLPMIPGIDGVGRRADGKRSSSLPTTTSWARWPTRRWLTRGGRSNCRTTSTWPRWRRR